MRSKTYKAVKAKTDPLKKYNLDEAIDFIKSHARKTFDETIDLTLQLNWGEKDGSFSGSAVLPSGVIKNKKIAVFASGDNLATAKKAGADVTGGEDLIEQLLNKGKINFDIVLAEPAMIPKMVKIAKILGPRGMMPNPKNGTITQDFAGAIEKLKGGEVRFKIDKGNNLHQAVAKISWDKERIKANILAVIEGVKKAKTGKSSLIKEASLSSTMGPSLKIELS
jgi:large subunit ribosomal protein L1